MAQRGHLEPSLESVTIHFQPLLLPFGGVAGRAADGPLRLAFCAEVPDDDSCFTAAAGIGTAYMGFIVAVPISTPEDELVVPGSALENEVELPLSAMFGLGTGKQCGIDCRWRIHSLYLLLDSVFRNQFLG